MSASGPEMYVAIMTVCFSDSFEALEETKNELRKMKLTDFPGENVVDCAAKVLRLAERLDSAGEFDPNLLCAIARIFEHTSDERLKLFTYTKYDKCSALVKKLKVNTLDSLDEAKFLPMRTCSKTLLSNTGCLLTLAGGLLPQGPRNQRNLNFQLPMSPKSTSLFPQL